MEPRAGRWAPHLRGGGGAGRGVRTRAPCLGRGGSGDVAQRRRRTERARSLAPSGVISQRVCTSFPPPPFGAGPENGFGDGVVAGGELHGQRSTVRVVSVSAAGALPHLQDNRDRRLQCGQNVPDLPLLCRPLPRPHRGHYRGGFPRTSSGD